MDEKRINAAKGLKLFGAPWYITIVACIVVWGAMFTGVLGTDMSSTMALMLAIGVPLYEIGKRIPIWNSYIGGGILLAFLGTALLTHFAVIPDKYVKSIDVFTGKTGFLTVFIVILITGSVLSLDRHTLLKSFVGYFPAILGGVAAAMICGIIAGLFFNISPYRIITHYVLPIMGGGNGGGAVPLSQMYESVTGRSKDEYYNFAVIILTIANIYAILTAAFLNKLGNYKKSLTGDKFTLLRNDKAAVKEKKEEIVPSLADIAGGFLLSFTAYAAGLLLSKYILPLVTTTLFGKAVKIHALACMILLVVILAATGVVPEGVRMGAKRIQNFFSGSMTLVIMVGVGVDMSIDELINAVTSLSNIVIPLFIVIGAIIGSAVVGYFVGFYPIDTAVTAGLCMANRGGSGDLAVLGAAERMGLMAYAQLSSRLGGAIILIIGSICFAFML